MIGAHAQRFLWPLSAIASLGAALASQACSGRVQYSDGVGGASGGMAEAGNAAGAGSVASSGTGSVCAERVCADHCSSGVTESDETDTDCGGSVCQACADKRRCHVASDCQSLVCAANSCRTATCDDQASPPDDPPRTMTAGLGSIEAE